VHNVPVAAVDFFTSHQKAGYVTFHKEAVTDRKDDNDTTTNTTSISTFTSRKGGAPIIAMEYSFLKLDAPFFMATETEQ
jgi:hypothetical protein